jgi:hypothetical protein
MYRLRGSSIPRLVCLHQAQGAWAGTCYSSGVPGALLYVRVSTEEQQRRNVANLPTQEKKASEHSARLGIPILKVFVTRNPPEHGTGPDCKSYLITAESIGAKCRTSLWPTLAELARNVADQGMLISRLADMGVQLLSVDEPHIDRDSCGQAICESARLRESVLLRCFV